MEKNIAMNPERKGLTLLERTVSSLSSTLHKPMEWLRKYYSAVCEREIDARQTRLLLEAQVAFLLSVTVWGVSLLVHVALLAWFVYAVVRCKLAMTD